MEFVSEKTWDNSCKQFEDVIYDSLLMTRVEIGGEANAMGPGFSRISASNGGEHL
jgi:hypothetical protein